MFKRAISGSSRAFVFLIGPTLKCSYQNMATNLTKNVVVHPPPSSGGHPVSWLKSSRPAASSSLLIRWSWSKTLASRTSSKFARGRTGLGLGFSLGLLGLFESKEKEELTVEDKILMEMKRAILAIQEGEIKKAQNHLDNAWKMSEDEDLEKAKTQILDIQIGDLAGAERLFKTVCQRLVYHQEVSVKDNAIVEISIKLSQIMALTGRIEESMSGFQYCADTQKEKIEKEGVKDEDTLLLAAWSLHSLAQAYLSRGTRQNEMDDSLVKKASELATDAYNYASKAIGPDSQQALEISSDLASILALQGDIDAALERYKECEVIAAEKHNHLHPAIRVNTGSLYLQKGNYDEAERLCREAKRLAGKYRDKESSMRADECIVRSNNMKAEEKEQRIKN